MLQELFDKVKTKENIPENAYLAHFFFMPPSTYNVFSAKYIIEEVEIHVGFYNPDTHKIFSYKLLADTVEHIPEQEIFQKEKEVVTKVQIEEVKTTFDQILKKIAEYVFEKYRDTISLKTLVILQYNKDQGLVWNVTILRRDFKTLNIKIDAKTGDIVSENLSSLIDMGKTLGK